MTLTLERDPRTNEIIVTGPNLLIRFDGTMVNTNVMGAIGKLLNEIYEAGYAQGRSFAYRDDDFLAAKESGL